MLPSAHRMTRSADFAAAVRGGERVRRGDLVVHHLALAQPDTSRPALVGLVVGRSVGGSVVRHRVSRRLRVVVSKRLSSLAPGSSTVVRALPLAAQAGSARLQADFDAALQRLQRPPRVRR